MSEIYKPLAEDENRKKLTIGGAEIDLSDADPKKLKLSDCIDSDNNLAKKNESGNDSEDEEIDHKEDGGNFVIEPEPGWEDFDPKQNDKTTKQKED